MSQQQPPRKEDIQARQEAAAAARAAAAQDEEEEEEDTKDAFLDLNDPDNEIVDDGTVPYRPAGGAAAAGAGNDGGDDQQSEINAEDLENADFVTVRDGEEDGQPVVDKDPERDDAFLVFAQEFLLNDKNPQPKPLHCVAVNPANPTMVACGGEAETVFLMKLPSDKLPLAAAVQRQKQQQEQQQQQQPAEPKNDDDDGAEKTKEESQQKAAAAPAPAAAPGVTISAEPKQQDPAAIPEANRWQMLSLLSAHTDTVTRLAFSPDGLVLASGGLDGKVILWNVDPSQNGPASCKATFDELGGEVEALLWHPSSKLVCGSGTGAQIVMWNVAKGTAAQYFTGHRDSITCMAWSNDSKRLISASLDGSVALQNPNTGMAEVTVSKGISDEAAGILCMVVLPTPASTGTAAATAASADPLVLVGCLDGSLALVSLAGPKGRVVTRLAALHDQAVEHLSISPRELAPQLPPLIASCSCDCKVVLWGVPELAPRATIYVGEGVTRLVWFQSMLFAACTDGDVRVWESRAVQQQQTAAAAAAAASSSSSQQQQQQVTVPLAQFMGHRRLVLDVDLARTAAGPALVTVADDGSARAFSLVTQ